MRFEEALAFLRQGKKMTHSEWFYSLDENGNFTCYDNDKFESKHHNQQILSHELDGTDWDLFVEDKKPLSEKREYAKVLEGTNEGICSGMIFQDDVREALRLFVIDYIGTELNGLQLKDTELYAIMLKHFGEGLL